MRCVTHGNRMSLLMSAGSRPTIPARWSDIWSFIFSTTCALRSARICLTARGSQCADMGVHLSPFNNINSLWCKTMFTWRSSSGYDRTRAYAQWLFHLVRSFECRSAFRKPTSACKSNRHCILINRFPLTYCCSRARWHIESAAGLLFRMKTRIRQQETRTAAPRECE